MKIELDAYLANPVLWVELARELAEAEGKLSIPDSLTKELAGLDRPILVDRTIARKEFWALLALPWRHVGLRFLDKHGLLGELIPCWEGNRIRKDLRLNAIEQVHREVWRTGLTEQVYQSICDVHDVVIDRRLNRWALTALGTLLAGGDTENQLIWTKSVRRDLHAFGATEAEVVWIERLVREFNSALLFLRSGEGDVVLRPEHVVACLSTLAVGEPEALPRGVENANRGLSGSLNPLDKEETE